MLHEHKSYNMHYDDERKAYNDKQNQQLNAPWLMQGDCLERMKEIPDGSVDMILTDPPYKTTKRGNSGGTGGMLKAKEFINGNGGFKLNDIKITDYLPELMRVMKDGAHCYLMCNDKNLITFSNEILKSGFKIFKTLVWVKDNCVTNMYYMTSHEYVIFFRKGKAVKINDCGVRQTLSFKNPRNKLHPSEKPVGLMEVLIKSSSVEGQTVLDLFMGSGSTGVAAKNLNRKFIGIELDEEYFKIAQDRISAT